MSAMFTLKLYDRKGIELNLGDIVKISDGRWIEFFAEITYLEKDKCIAPFHTFSFHSFEKVDKVPENALRATEERYNVYYLINKEEDYEAKNYESYLTEWRSCEHLLEKGYYRIIKAEENTERTSVRRKKS